MSGAASAASTSAAGESRREHAADGQQQQAATLAAQPPQQPAASPLKQVNTPASKLTSRFSTDYDLLLSVPEPPPLQPAASSADTRRARDKFFAELFCLRPSQRDLARLETRLASLSTRDLVAVYARNIHIWFAHAVQTLKHAPRGDSRRDNVVMVRSPSRFTPGHLR